MLALYEDMRVSWQEGARCSRLQDLNRYVGVVKRFIRDWVCRAPGIPAVHPTTKTHKRFLSNPSAKKTVESSKLKTSKRPDNGALSLKAPPLVTSYNYEQPD
jgi:hypothetical protein